LGKHDRPPELAQALSEQPPSPCSQNTVEAEVETGGQQGSLRRSQCPCGSAWDDELCALSNGQASCSRNTAVLGCHCVCEVGSCHSGNTYRFRRDRIQERMKRHDRAGRYLPSGAKKISVNPSRRHRVQPKLELWGGVECTINRVNDRYMEQLRRTGHVLRISDLDLFAELGIKALRQSVLWEASPAHRSQEERWGWAKRCLRRLDDLGIRPIVGLLHHG
jgi:hypothetical protein